jgi:hypothetical protein
MRSHQTNILCDGINQLLKDSEMEPLDILAK